jgi:two-component system chemotaxis sensor kinase CheA
MIRNAVDHGIEPVQERLKSGKPGMALIRLSAYHESGNIVIEISDDGRGLNQEAILTKALAQGLIQEGQKLSDAEIYDLIFKPGFSTAKQVTEISGRGVGMDVVKRNVEAMRGRIVISTVPGQGTTFKIILPLTLAIIEGMLVACGDERYIIPTLSIIESIKPDQSMLFSFAGKSEVINVRGDIFSLLRLDRLFNIPGAKTDPTQALVVVVESLGRKIGLMVDDVITQQQVVIKSLGTGMPGTQFVSNAAILSDGKVGLILNVEEISTVFDDRNIKSRLQEKLATVPTNTTS